MYNEPSQKVEKRRQRISEGDASRGIAQIGRMTANAMGGENGQQVQMQDPDDEPEEPQLTVWVAALTLGISTALVAVCAEFMVDSISALTSTGNIGEVFVGLILLPIVGNAAEHATAVTVACKDKMDLAIGVAVGSSMQIALLVLPFIVVLGWIIGVEDMVCFVCPTFDLDSRLLTFPDSELRCIPGHRPLRCCFAGELSHRGWEESLAGGRFAYDDVFDHRYCCLVCTRPVRLMRVLKLTSW